jgi:hypothetical protein
LRNRKYEGRLSGAPNPEMSGQLVNSCLKGKDPMVDLLNVLGDGVRIIDPNFRIIYENQTHRRLLGTHVGEYCYEAYQQRNDVCENCPLDRSFRDGKVHKEIKNIISGTDLKYIEITSSTLMNETGKAIAGVEIVRDVTERKQMEDEKEKLISELKEALNRIRTLKGLIPICAWCKKVRDDHGYWKRVEKYIEEHSEASFTHSICPRCLKKADPELFDEFEKEMAERENNNLIL